MISVDGWIGAAESVVRYVSIWVSGWAPHRSALCGPRHSAGFRGRSVHPAVPWCAAWSTRPASCFRRRLD